MSGQDSPPPSEYVPGNGGEGAPTAEQRTYTLQEIEDLTGVTVKALRGRIDRGNLQAVRKDGRVLVPRAELIRVGLLDAEGEPIRGERGEVTPRGPAGPVDLTPLIERLLAQERELAEVRRIAAQAESLADGERRSREEVERALHEARAEAREAEARASDGERRAVAAESRVADLEDRLAQVAARRPWWRRMLGGGETTAREEAADG